MALLTYLTDTSKEFGGNYRNCGGSRDRGGANLGIRPLPDNLKTLTVTITATPNANGDGGLNRIQLRWPGGQILAEITASPNATRSITYTFGAPGNKTIAELKSITPTSLWPDPYLDIRYVNDAPGGGGWDSSDPCDYYRKISEDSLVIKAYNGDVPVDGGEGRLTITLTDSYVLDGGTPPPVPGQKCSAPTPWNQLGVPDSCGSPPSTSTTLNGINVTASGNSVTINLANYANKLASINFSHTVGSTWSNGLSFSIPQASDIIVGSTDISGLPYSKGSYTNSNMPGSTLIKIGNLDGGNYGYTFTHSSTTAPVPTRTNYTRTCTTSTETVITTNPDGSTTETEVTTETCTCTPYTETYPGTWPPCPTGVYIVRTGGETVEWVYSDGRDGSYSAQRSTLSISSTRPIVPLTGPITLAVADQSLYIRGMPSTRFSVNSYRTYANDPSNPGNKFRFRDPRNRQCLSGIITDPGFDDDTFAAFSEFRSYAGAQRPA